MKAIVQDTYGETNVLSFTDIDIPVVGDNEVLVRVHAAGVDPGVWHVMTGLPYLVRVMGFGLRRPKVPVRGRDVAGRVEAVGKDVTRFKPGDEVYGTCEGSFAQYVCAREDRIARKPANLTYAEAAAVPISGATALQALRNAGKAQAGQKVLVIGASGGVGSFTVQLAKAFGMHVTGVCSTARTSLVRSIGADEVIDYTREDVTDTARGYDLVVDTAGRRPLSQLRRTLAPKGTLVIVGGEGGSRWTGGFERSIWAGLLSSFVGHKLRGLIASENSADLDVLRELIEAGKVTPIIEKTYPLSAAADAIRHVAQGHVGGKVVVTI